MQAIKISISPEKGVIKEKSIIAGYKDFFIKKLKFFELIESVLTSSSIRLIGWSRFSKEIPNE